MRIIRVMFLAVLVISTASCSGGKKKGDKVEKAKGTMKLGGKEVAIYKGGVFKMNQSEKPSTLFPHGVAELTGHHIANQVYEGLVKLNQANLKVENCLAEDIQISEDARVFTYTIRKGVKFHDDMCFKGGKGRELKAQDFKYCLDQLCMPSSMTKTKQNELSGLVKSKILGAMDFYNASLDGNVPEGGIEGVKVLDDYTLEITLEEPFAGFNKIMSTPAGWVFPKEAVEAYGEEMRDHPVGTGPFMIKKIDLNRQVFLQRNDNYWDEDEHGNELPYLDGLKYTFMAEKKTEFQSFNKGDLDMVWKIPVEEIDNVLDDLNDANNNAKQVLQSTNGLGIQYYAFLQGSEIFDDVRVRRAFNLAIDRENLVTYTLHGEGEPAIHGFVPPIPGYPSDSVKGYEYSEAGLQEARRLLAEAGYPNGNGFPTVKLRLNRGGNINLMVAEAIQYQLNENLGVSIEFDILPLNQHRLKFETGNSDFWRIAWVADYPDPENFLNLFHGKYVPDDPNERTMYNSTRYVNPEFDELFDKAVQTVDEKERMSLFAEADQILIDDAVVVPLYYESYQRLVAKKVKNFPINAMEYRDFTRVFFDKE